MWQRRILKNRKIRNILLVLSLLLSCTTKSNKNNIYDETLILGDKDYKVWLMQRDSIRLPGAYYWYFDKDSTYMTLLRDLRGKNSSTFVEFSYNDVLLSNKWYLKNDTLYLNSFPLIVLRQVKDTIILLSKKRDNTFETVYLIYIGIPPKSIRKNRIRDRVDKAPKLAMDTIMSVSD